MFRIIIEDITGKQPVLVHLARVFDKITRRTTEAWIFDVIVQRMQCVTKFVKERCCIIQTNKRWFPFAAFDKVIII